METDLQLQFIFQRILLPPTVQITPIEQNETVVKE